MSLKDHAGVALSPRPSRFGPLLFAGHLEQGLEQASALGFPYVELSIRAVDDVNPQELNRKLGELNLKISALATGQACLFDCLCLGSDHDQKRENAVAHFKGITQLAKDIHSEAVIIGGIRGPLAGEGTTREQNYTKAVAAIRECALFTDELGIQLLIEPINRYEMNWILTAREGLQFLQDVGVASVKLLMDTFHMNIEEADTLAALELAGERLGYVHFADNIRQAPGSGQINFDAILNKLEAMDYHGPLVAEILPLPDDLTAIQKTAAFWQERSAAAITG
jgi:sugar phosphate isomerase/epimerase